MAIYNYNIKNLDNFYIYATAFPGEEDTSLALIDFTSEEIDVLKKIEQDQWTQLAGYSKELWVKVQGIASENDKYKQQPFAKNEILFLKELLNKNTIIQDLRNA